MVELTAFTLRGTPSRAHLRQPYASSDGRGRDTNI